MSVKTSQQHMSSQHDSIRGTTPKDIHFPLFFKPPGIAKSCYTLETAFPRLNTPVTRLTISSSHKLQPGRDTRHAHTPLSPFRPIHSSIHTSGFINQPIQWRISDRNLIGINIRSIQPLPDTLMPVLFDDAFKRLGHDQRPGC